MQSTFKRFSAIADVFVRNWNEAMTHFSLSVNSLDESICSCSLVPKPCLLVSLRGFLLYFVHCCYNTWRESCRCYQCLGDIHWSRTISCVLWRHDTCPSVPFCISFHLRISSFWCSCHLSISSFLIQLSDSYALVMFVLSVETALVFAHSSNNLTLSLLCLTSTVPLPAHQWSSVASVWQARGCCRMSWTGVQGRQRATHRVHVHFSLNLGSGCVGTSAQLVVHRDVTRWAI